MRLRTLILQMALALVAAMLLSLVSTLAAPGTALAQNGSDWRCVLINGSGDLNVRGGPGTGYPVLGSLAPYTAVEADYARLTTGSGYNWVPVRYPLEGSLREGWAITPRLTPCPEGIQIDLGPAVQPTDAPATALTMDDMIPDAPGTLLAGVNRDGQLDRAEIEQVARSVVLVANIRRDRVIASGTGTIITPEGLVLTNAHVVEDADYAAIGMLNDINDPPEYRYIADIIGLDSAPDAALLAIRSDMNGNAIAAETLNLPYIPATLAPGDVFRGDSIYIFGYPSIGDDYLVVTHGSIVSVENGDVDGQRMPVWYRTDAEIAPGNSGGLAVNGNGEFVGIPTFVRSEGETGGRLGGIRPAQVALLAVLNTPGGVFTTDLIQSATVPHAFTAYAAVVDQITVTHGVVQADQAGIAITASFTLTGWQDRRPILYARLFFDTLAAEPVLNPNAPLRYRGPNDQVRVAIPLAPPTGSSTPYRDLALFIPYEVLGLTTPGPTPLMIEVGVSSADGAWTRALSWEFVTVTVEPVAAG